MYYKVPKFSDARKPCCNQPKIQIKKPNLRVFYQKDANGKANSEDPDKTAPLGAVCSGSALFAKTNLSEKIRIIMVDVIAFVTRKTQVPVFRVCNQAIPRPV